MSLLHSGSAGNGGKDTQDPSEAQAQLTIKAGMFFRINTMALALARYSRLGVVQGGDQCRSNLNSRGRCNVVEPPQVVPRGVGTIWQAVLSHESPVQVSTGDGSKSRFEFFFVLFSKE